MIVTISGMPGSGKSVIAKLVAKKLGFRHYSTGEFFREMAAKLKMSLEEFSLLCEKDKKYDLETDAWQQKLGEKEDNFVIDARLGFHFIPNSKKIFLEVDIKEAAKRIFNDKTRTNGPESVEQELNLIKLRQKSELQRYKRYYNIDLYNKKNYDLVIDTTRLSPQEIASRIIAFVKQ